MNVILGMILACCAFSLIGYCQEKDERAAAQQARQEHEIKRGDKWQELTERSCEMVACGGIK